MSMLYTCVVFTVVTILVDIGHKQVVTAQNYQLTSSCGGSVQAGGSCTLMCYTGEASHTAIQWLNGTTFYIVRQGSCSSTYLPADYITSCPSSTNYTLTINNAVYGRDILSWRCDYQFGGRESNRIQMDVQVPLSSVTITRTIAYASCVAVSNPPPSMTLYRDRISVATSPAAVEGDTGWTTTVNYQLPGTSRNSLYYCQASNTQTTINSTYSYPEIAVSSVSLTTITSANQEVGAAEGQPLTLTCVTSASYPAATVTWYKNSVEVTVGISSSSTITSGVAVQATSALTFTSVVMSDLGHTVYCRATNIHTSSPVQSDSARMGVWYPPPVPPSITKFETLMFEGDPETVSCSVTGGNPLATITWSCPGTGSASVSDSGQTRTSTLSFIVSKSQNSQQCQCLGAWQYGGYNQSDVRTFSVSCPTNPQPLNAEYNMAGVIAGSTIGTLLLTLLIGALVLFVLYRKGFRFGNVLKGSSSPKRIRHPDIEEMENTVYSSLDQINSQTQNSNMDREASEKQHYTQLKIYENTNVEPKAETSTYEDMTEAPPVSYESISASPYQNSGAQPQDPDYGNK